MITLLSLYTQQSLLLSVFLKIHATKGFSMIPHSTKPRPGIAAPNSIVEREINFRLHKGYTLNQQGLQQKSIEFEQAAALLSQTLTNRALINEEGVLGLQLPDSLPAGQAVPFLAPRGQARL